MKYQYRQSLRFLIASIIVAGAWAVAPLGPTGCSTIAPQPTLSAQASDQIILRAEQTAETAKLTFNTFLHLERDNEALLKQASPQVHVWAENIRRNGIGWIQDLRTDTKLFKTTRNAQNQATLNTAIITLTNAVAQTQKYITQAKKVGQS